MIGRGDQHEGLYVLRTKVVQIDVMTTSLGTKFVSTDVNNVSFHTWHNRLGHLSFKQLVVLKCHLHCIVSKCTNDDICYICPLA